MTLARAVLFKEWIKLRLLVWVPVIALIAVTVDVWLTYKTIRAMHGATALWSALVYKQDIFFANMRWVLVGGGVWFACLQFLPECSGKRLRLLFHLPVTHRFSLYIIVAVGLLLTVMLSAMGIGGLLQVCSLMGFPPELAYLMAGSLLPWALAGMVAYCATAAIIAEPSLVRKLAFALFGYAYVNFLGASIGFSSMSEDMWLYVLACLPWPLCLEAAALRVKEGRA